MTVLWVLLVLFAILGITELIGAIICRFTLCKNVNTMFITTVKNENDYEIAVRGIIERSKWSCFTPQKILIVTENFSSETLSDISFMISGYPNIELCDKKDCKILL